MRTGAATTVNARFLFVPGLLLTPGPALAHHFMDDALPQTFAQGLLSGLGHPLIGADHAAFIVAAGFLLALVPRGLRGLLALIAGSLIGAALHLQGYTLPAGEIGVALSVLLLGGLVLARRRIHLLWLAGGLAFAGVLHGHAYAETIFGAETTPLLAYLIGFSVVQFGVAMAAALVHRQVHATRERWARPLAAALGTVVSTVGLVSLAINITG